jgi:beta-glucanase (GH16 family)
MAGIRAILGFFPKTFDYENNRSKLEEEYNELLAFRTSKELRAYHELDAYIRSEEFAQKKKDIISLNFKNTDDFQKEKQYRALAGSSDIKLYLKTRDSGELKRFRELEKSETLKKYHQLDDFIRSEKFMSAKREASLSSKEKFRKSDLAKTFNLFNTQQNSPKIQAYFRFAKNKFFSEYEAALKEQLPEEVDKLAKADASSAEYKQLIKSPRYRKYRKLARSPYRKSYDDLKGSDEIEAFSDLKRFITSEDFKRQKKEIESKGFKDTEEYQKLIEFNELKNSDNLKFYRSYKNSKALKTYTSLHGSDRIRQYETLKNYIESDEFIRFRTYATLSPKKRWRESKECEKLQEHEDVLKSDKIQWFLKNIDSPRFEWLRHWNESFSDTFGGKSIDKAKWMTRYYYGEKMLKDTYSLSSDKHFITDGKNVEIDQSKLIITVRKEQVKGKSWHPTMGFITREFGYTSGLINTGKSFRQLYGTFEAKMRVTDSKDIMNAFWMVGTKQVPHINIVKAHKKVSFGNIWGDAVQIKSIKSFTKSYRRGKFAREFYIYTLEWTPGKLIWKINGLEIARSTVGVPDEPMYLAFSGGLQKEVDGSLLPAKFEVDWVRCYQHESFGDKS